jgi:hypothetical protein
MLICFMGALDGGEMKAGFELKYRRKNKQQLAGAFLQTVYSRVNSLFSSLPPPLSPSFFLPLPLPLPSFFLFSLSPKLGTLGRAQDRAAAASRNDVWVRSCRPPTNF